MTKTNKDFCLKTKSEISAKINTKNQWTHTNQYDNAQFVDTPLAYIATYNQEQYSCSINVIMDLPILHKMAASKPVLRSRGIFFNVKLNVSYVAKIHKCTHGCLRVSIHHQLERLEMEKADITIIIKNLCCVTR